MDERSSISVHSKVYAVDILGNTIFTTVTKIPDAVAEWINKLKPDNNTLRRHVGFEVEYEDTDHTRIGTLQLCLANSCLILQVPHGRSPCPPSLAQFLGDPANAFISADIQNKMTMLKQQLPFAEQVHCLDLSDLRAIDPPPTDQKKTLLGLIALDAQDWGRLLDLSATQVQYACLDAFLNLQFTKHFY
ncbi:hypothetical protein ACS0TY_016600 [Phlomoides rotata]